MGANIKRLFVFKRKPPVLILVVSLIVVCILIYNIKSQKYVLSIPNFTCINIILK